MFATEEVVGLAEWIIDDICLVDIKTSMNKANISLIGLSTSIPWWHLSNKQWYLKYYLYSTVYI